MSFQAPIPPPHDRSGLPDVRQVSYMSKWTGGGILNYDESNTVYQDPDTPTSPRTTAPT